MKKMIISILALAAVSVQAALITDDFNRADANGTGINTLNTIGNNWVGEGARRWDIVSNELKSNTGAGSFIYNIGLGTLNSDTETSFTQTAYIAVNTGVGTAFGGMVVNFDTNTNTGVTFRFAGNGIVNLLRPNGTVITSGTFSSAIVTDRAYRMTISSDASNTYDLEIYDPIAATTVYSAANVVNGGASANSDGFGGLYANTLGVTYDDFSLNVIPEPGTLGLISISMLGVFITRRLRRS